MIVAVVGSREGVSLDRVAKWIDKLWAKDRTITLVSGGADGVDRCAEQTWIHFGGSVISFRPKRLPDFQFDPVYGVEVWNLSPEKHTIHVPDELPTWGDYASACNFRDMLIAEKADRCVAFWNGASRGTAGTIFFFEQLGKPVHVFKEA